MFLSSATDPYQAVEAKYGLTRRCLQVLLQHDYPVIILTGSHLILRDLDILSRFRWIRVGMSITTVPNRLFEPRVPPLDRRIDTLRRLSAAGITTWVSFAPIVPNLFMVDLEDLLRRLKDAGVQPIHTGLLRFEGYEASRRMFEERSGASYYGAVLGASSVLRHIQETIERYGFNTDNRIFEWRDHQKTLGEYIVP